MVEPNGSEAPQDGYTLSSGAVIPDDVMKSVVVPDEPDPSSLSEPGEKETPAPSKDSDPDEDKSNKGEEKTGVSFKYDNAEGENVVATEDDISKWRKSHTRLKEREAKLTQHSQENAEAYKKLQKDLKLIADLKANGQVMEAFDEHFGKDENPLRLINLESVDSSGGEKPSGETEKRLQELEKAEQDRKDHKAAEERMQIARGLVEAEIEELVEIDPVNLKKGKVHNTENIQKILEYAADWNKKHEKDTNFRSITLMEAWMEVFGKRRLGVSKIRDKSKSVKTKTTPGSAPGAKAEAPKAGEAKTMNEARNSAFAQYQNSMAGK